MKKLFLILVSAICFSVQAAPTFTQAQIDDAMGQKLIGYTNVGSNPSIVLSAQAFHYLALATHFNPAAVDSGNKALKDRVLAHFRNLISGGKEPYCGQPLYAWSDGAVGQSLLIIKNTPVLWNSLNSAEQSGADLLMKALAIGSNWAFNDQNNFKTGLGDEGNFEKTYNPNFTQGDIGIMIAAAIYFGPTECNAIFTNFSYADYIAQFNARGWSNIVKNWKATGSTLMEHGGMDGHGGTGAGVKVPFVYCGKTLFDLNGIFYAASVRGSPKPMYGAVVSNTEANGKAYIISRKSSPVLGMNGMCYEFDSSDSGGIRSDALYSYEGWMNSVGTRASMMMMGAWGGSNQLDTEAHMLVGSTDLIFKLKEGYHGVYLGSSRDIYDTELPAGKGYFYNKDIWDNYVNSSVQPPPPPPPTGPNTTVQSGPLQITFHVSSDWKTAYTADVMITNTGTVPISQWKLTFELPSTITKIWNASIASHSGVSYSIAPLSWNQKIAPGASVNFGFNAKPGDLENPPANIKAVVQ